MSSYDSPLARGVERKNQLKKNIAQIVEQTQDASSTFNIALSALKNGNAALAIKKFEQVLTIDNSEDMQRQVRPNLGQAKLQAGETPAALREFRAALKLASLIDVEIGGDRLKFPLRGKLLDVSATGCKLRFEGDISERMQLGQVYERFIASLPFGNMTTPVELRHLHFEERINTTFAGVRFHNMSGLVQRQVERFVYQLQREARRFDKDDDF